MAEQELERPTPRIAFNGLLLAPFCMPERELERPTIAFSGLLLAIFCISSPPSADPWPPQGIADHEGSCHR